MRCNIPYAALLRAARICSDVHDFEFERIKIDITLLLNDYPPAFIEKHLRRFFELNDAVRVSEQLNIEQYHILHRRLLDKPTRRERQLKQKEMPLDQVKNTNSLNLPWNSSVIYAPYIFESGPRLALQSDFRKWWEYCYRSHGPAGCRRAIQLCY